MEVAVLGQGLLRVAGHLRQAVFLRYVICLNNLVVQADLAVNGALWCLVQTARLCEIVVTF